MYGGHGYGYGYQQLPLSTPDLARVMTQNRPSEFNTTAITAPDKSSGHTGGMDVIEWAKWDVLGDR